MNARAALVLVASLVVMVVALVAVESATVNRKHAQLVREYDAVAPEGITALRRTYQRSMAEAGEADRGADTEPPAWRHHLDRLTKAETIRREIVLLGRRPPDD
jgi:hypothetical protein